LGATPVFYDVDPERELEYRPGEVTGKITSRTRAFIHVDYFGIEKPIDNDLQKQLKSRNIQIIKDAAHSYLSLVHTSFRNLSDFDATVSSVYKSLPTMVGSVLFTKNAQQTLPEGQVSLHDLVKRALKQLMKQLSGKWLYRRFLRQLTFPVALEPDLQNYQTNGNRLSSLFFCALSSRMEVNQAIADRRHNTLKYQELLREYKAEEVRALFQPSSLNDAVPIGFALIFDNKVRRDATLLSLLKRGIDAYTWPYFSSLDQDELSWSKILVLPVNKDHSQALKHALSENHVSLR
jgi:dTDP-4-amino-4,6-dideoxygalactose transaminase